MNFGHYFDSVHYDFDVGNGDDDDDGHHYHFDNGDGDDDAV
jgi:hypothetical protein